MSDVLYLCEGQLPASLICIFELFAPKSSISVWTH